MELFTSIEFIPDSEDIQDDDVDETYMCSAYRNRMLLKLEVIQTYIFISTLLSLSEIITIISVSRFNYSFVYWELQS